MKMILGSLALGLGLVLSTLQSFAGEGRLLECFEVARPGSAFSSPAEQLCVRDSGDHGLATLTLETLAIGKTPVRIATVNLNLISRVRCEECNQDLFGIRGKAAGALSALEVQFDGTRDPSTGKEEGTVNFLGTVLQYRKR